MLGKDYYAVLGIQTDATYDSIHRGYRYLAMLHHPDKKPGDAEAEQRMREINEAWDILGDAEKKKRYDSGHGRDLENRVSTEAREMQHYEILYKRVLHLVRVNEYLDVKATISQARGEASEKGFDVKKYEEEIIDVIYTNLFFTLINISPQTGLLDEQRVTQHLSHASWVAEYSHIDVKPRAERIVKGFYIETLSLIESIGALRGAWYIDQYKKYINKIAKANGIDSTDYEMQIEEERRKKPF